MPAGQSGRRRAAATKRNRNKSDNPESKNVAMKSHASMNRQGLEKSVEDVDMSEGAVRPKIPGRETRSNSLDELPGEDTIQVNIPKSKKIPGKHTQTNVPSFQESPKRAKKPIGHAADFETADVEVRKSPYYSDLKTRDRDAKIYTADWFYYKVTSW